MRSIFNTTLAALLVITFAAVSFSAELSVKTFRINYMDAEEAEALVKGLLSPEGSTAVHAGTNTLLVKDTEKNLVEIEKALAQTDVKPEMLRVEVRYADKEDIEGLDVDLDWNYKDNGWSVGNARLKGGKGLTAKGTAEVVSKKITKRGKSSLLIMSGKSGSIASGQSIEYDDWFYWYSRNHGYYLSQRRFKNATTGFVVEPRIKGGTISVKITPEVSYLAEGGQSRIVYDRISTEVNVEDGVPVVLGANPSDKEKAVNNFIGGRSREASSRDFYMVLTVTVEK